MSMLPWIGFAAAAGLAGYTNPMAQPGETCYTTTPTHHLRVMLENDSFVNEDNGYSNGARIDYVQETGRGMAYGLSLTQNIYTPYTKACGNVMGEHPYAGYLALGGAIIIPGEKMGFTAELQIGTTGKASLADESQHLVHAVGDMDQWRGWHDQIPSEMTFQLTMRQDWRLPFFERRFCNRYETDGTLFAREQLGTVAIGGGVGLTLRFGKNLPGSMQVFGNEAGNFGMGTLEKPDFRRDELSWFVYAQTQLRYVGRDMFIDGGVFHSFEQTCSRKPWVAELQVGGAVSYKGIDYYLGLAVSTDTYRGEAKTPMHGTCGITWHW